MSRLTITLSDERYRALKAAAAQRNTTMGQLIDDSLNFFGIKTPAQTQDLLQRVRARSTLSEAQALALAQAEVQAERSAS